MKKTVIFAGGDTQTGTTMLAMAAAEELAKEGMSVLCLRAGAWTGTEFLSENTVSAGEEVLAGLMAENLSAKELQQAVGVNRGVDILPGIRRGRNGWYFLQEDLETICCLAETLWDWVIIDLGSVQCCRYTLDILALAGQIYMVVTQQEKTIERFRKWSAMQNGIQWENVRFLLNKYTDAGSFPTVEDMAERLQCRPPEILTVPYVPYGWQAEAERTTLLNFRRFRKAVRNLTEQIKAGGADGKADV